MKIIKTILILFLLLFVYSSLHAQEKNKEFSNRGISTGSFVSLGPKEASIYDITAHPTQKNIMYLLTDYYEKDYSYRGIDYYSSKRALTKTTDSGDTWSLVSFLPNMGFLFCNIDPNNLDKIYLGGGRYFSRSTNGGYTWSNIHLGNYIDELCGVKINHNNPDIIYGYGENRTSLSNEICFLKSDDGGDNWNTTILESDTTRFSFGKNLWAFDDSNPQNIYIAANYTDTLGIHPLLFMSADTGTTWNDLNIEQKTGAAGQILSFNVDRDGCARICIDGYGLYRSTDYGENWLKLTDYPDNLVSMKSVKEDPNIIVGGSIDTVFISSDGGSSWSKSGICRDGGVIENIIINSPTEFIAGNNMGVFKSIDAGLTWTSKNTGLCYNPVMTFDIYKNNPDVIYASVYERGIYKTTDSGENWDRIHSYTYPSIVYPSIAISNNTSSIIYAVGRAGIYKKTDVDSSWNRIKYLRNDYRSNIIVKDSLIYAACEDRNTGLPVLLKSTDNGINWIESGIASFAMKPQSLAIDPNNNNIIYVGGFYQFGDYTYGIVLKSEDGGNLWGTVFDVNILGSVKTMCVDPSNPDNIYFGTETGIYKSTDAGNNWDKINYLPCNALYVDSNGILYSGGDYNVVMSSDGETNWETFQQGMSSEVTRNGLIIDENNNILYAATKNQGILTLDLNAATKIKRDGNKPVSSFQLFGTYPNPFNQQTVIRFQVSGVRFQGSGVREQVLGGARVTLQIYNILGQLVVTLIDEEKQPGEYRVIWNGKDIKGNDVPSGLYFYRMHAGDFTDVKKMILLR